MTSTREPHVQNDTMDNILDRIGNMREELLSIQRSLERMQTEKSQQWEMARSKTSA